MKFQNNRDVISKSTACLVKAAPTEENRVKMATSDKDAAHRNVIKFCFDLDVTPVETQKKLQLTEAHRHVSRSLVYKWHERFEDGWTDSLNGKSGRPREINASTVDNVNDVIRSDRRQTVREVGEKLGLSKISVHRVLNKDLSMNKVCARWIPRLLTDNEKERRVGFCFLSVSKEIIERTAVWWFRRSQRCYLGNNKEDGQFLVSVGV